MPVRIGCVVMASGSSKRFGERRQKLLMDFCGRPLLLHALSCLPGDLARIVVVARDPAVAFLARGHGCEVILHRLPEARDTIRLGAQAMLGMDGALFLVCDQPLLAPATIEAMLRAFQQNPDRIVRAASGGQEGNPALFPAALFDELCALAPGERGAAVIARHRPAVLPVDAQPWELLDADTPEVLADLSKKYANNLNNFL